MTQSPERIEAACMILHNAYEKAAPVNGWSSKVGPKPWGEVPEASKATMRSAMAELLDFLATVDD